MKIDILKEVLNKWGVYKITNIITNDCYIGSTTESFKKRICYKHISDYTLWDNNLKKSSHILLHRAIKKHGLENFKVEVLIYFNRKKDSKTNKKVATYLEERFIKKLNGQYNICKFPTKEGCPNLGRKLSEEWKTKIAEKSRLYKHSSNQEILLKKSQQNKELSAVYRIWKDDFEFIGSFINCCKIINSKSGIVSRWVTGKSKSKKGYQIELIKSQKKKIKIYNNNFSQVFNSFGECDRFLNMWRGFTSTQVTNRKNKIFDYDYKLL